ncbi:hypothetical protein WDW37_05415 [Bdellovibrionota bacterium FG-1]
MKFDDRGKAFETYRHHEIRTYCDLNGIHDLCYWRSQQKDEVDFILGGTYAFDVKGKATISIQDLKGLIRLKEEHLLKKYFVIYTGREIRYLLEDRSIVALPYEVFLERLYDGEWGR